jgi:hypothetical protein
MKIRIAILLGLLIACTPDTTMAQADASPSPGGVDSDLVAELCAAGAGDVAAEADCIDAVQAALTQMTADVEEGGRSLIEQAQSIIDETAASVEDALSQARQIDLQATLDDIVEHARAFELDLDLQGAIDEAVAALDDLDLDVDVQTTLEDAVAQALAAGEDFDLATAVDGALSEARAAIENADVQGTVAALQDGVEQARAVVATAQQWAQANTDVVCRGGSVSLGTTVGVAVFALTGVEWLGLQAFWATERFTNGVCGELVE